VLSPLAAVVWAAFFNFAAAFGFGTAVAKTMGSGFIDLSFVDPLVILSETGGAMSVFLASFLGIPVSTTHVITGSIAGVGAANGISAVRWGVAGRIVCAWILTTPAPAAIGAVAYLLLHLIVV